MGSTIVLLPGIQMLGPVTNSSSEMFICLTNRTPETIFQFLKEVAETEAALDKDDKWNSWQCDLDKSSVKILKGSELVAHLANTWECSMEPTDLTLASEDAEEREWSAARAEPQRRLPELSSILFQALTTLPFEVINKYNLSALPYSWPIYKIADWETDREEYKSAMAAGIPEEDFYKEQDLKDSSRDEQNKACLLEWVEQNREALDILIPNAVVFDSAWDNSVGPKMMDTITNFFNGVRIHLG